MGTEISMDMYMGQIHLVYKLITFLADKYTST